MGQRKKKKTPWKAFFTSPHILIFEEGTQNKKREEIKMSFRESVITADGHKYVGELKSVMGIAGLVCDGLGTMQYTNGDRYIGEWKVNKRDGCGTHTYVDGSVYDGEWKSDKRHGCGQLLSTKGEIYEGSFHCDERQGVGTQQMNGEKYTGAFLGNRRQGRGILDMVGGGMYEGFFENNAMCGQGTMRFSNGDTFIGAFLNNAMHGQGIYTFLNLDEYHGTYKDGIRTGGVILRRSGKRYEAKFTAKGEVESLVEHGTGTAIQFDRVEETQGEGDWTGKGQGTIADKEDRYEGNIEEGKKHGKGKLRYANGDSYDGDWTYDVRHGEGKLNFEKIMQVSPTLKGWRYVGRFDKDQFDGHGEFWFDTEGGKYIGKWQQGKRHGLGREEICGDVYSGDFFNDKRHGGGILKTREGAEIHSKFVENEAIDDEATILYPDGAQFIGSVVGKARHGEGRMKFANGDEYDGEYCNDVRRGVGMVAFQNGDSYSGTWLNDLMHGSGTLTWADGTVYEGKMCKGIKHGVGVLRTVDGTFTVVYRNNALEEKTPLL